MNNVDQRIAASIPFVGMMSDTSSAPAQSYAASFGRIATLESLREHLQWAIELEYFTLPPYLCALYSLDSGRNPEAAEVIASVLVEEMLHMTLAANLLNAAGGRPRLDIPEMLPGYPHPLPHGDRSFEISLFRFGPEAIETFLKIEQPSPIGAPPEGNNYETIGQFYDAIKRGFRELSAALGACPRIRVSKGLEWLKPDKAARFASAPVQRPTSQHHFDVPVSLEPYLSVLCYP